jgi:hypothetical protein
MIVVSWMVEVAEEFRLQQETLHLAIGLLDRFLSSEEVSSSSTKHGWDMWMIHLAVDTATARCRFQLHGCCSHETVHRNSSGTPACMSQEQPCSFT